MNPGKLAKNGQVRMYERSNRADLLPVPGRIPDISISVWKTRPESPRMRSYCSDLIGFSFCGVGHIHIWGCSWVMMFFYPMAKGTF